MASNDAICGLNNGSDILYAIKIMWIRLSVEQFRIFFFFGKTIKKNTFSIELILVLKF